MINNLPIVFGEIHDRPIIELPYEISVRHAEKWAIQHYTTTDIGHIVGCSFTIFDCYIHEKGICVRCCRVTEDRESEADRDGCTYLRPAARDNWWTEPVPNQ